MNSKKIIILGANGKESIEQMYEKFEDKEHKSSLSDKNVYDIIREDYKNRDSIIVDLETLINRDILYDIVYIIDREKTNTYDNIDKKYSNIYELMKKSRAIDILEDVYENNDYGKYREYEIIFTSLYNVLVNDKLVDSLVNAYSEGSRIYVCSKYKYKHNDALMELLNEMISKKYNMECLFNYSSYDYGSFSKDHIIKTLVQSIKDYRNYTKTLIIIPKSEKPLNIVTKKTDLKVMYI